MAKTYEIHPAIGVARLGPSPDFYFGPEPDGIFPPPIVTGADGKPRSLRDDQGALRPQAARFRIFEVERQGSQLVSAREVTAAEAEIGWRVHVVNRKGAAPRFTFPGTSNRNTDPSKRRNGAKDTDDLNDPINMPLIINAGMQAVNSTAATPVSLQGTFRGRSVSLGRIFTEAASGRLIFVGGAGISDSVPPGGLSSQGTDFADNNNWFDDTCDGSIEAELTFKADGRHEAVRPAWLISGPYDFAPEVTNLVTVYDILFELAVDNGLRTIPNPVCFDRDILPIFDRLFGYQWVNARARSKHGKGKPFDFFTLPKWQDLGDPASVTGNAHRQAIFEHLREPGTPAAPNPPEMPLLHSDDFPMDTSVLWFTKVQFALLKAWANNQFQSMAPQPQPLELLPDVLTRMALQACVGRAFWPGIEVSIRIYDPTIFFADDPFRIANPGFIKPGLLTQSMSIPWQSDFLDCNQEQNQSGVTLAWWPAQRPNDVLPDSTPTTSQSWSREIADGEDMVKRWHLLGIVRKMASGEQHEIERTI